MPSIGERLAGRYRLDARIGSGGFATVFRARDLLLERDVAVKVLLASHTTDPVIAARFDREARVLAAVSHPNVVAVHDVAPGDPATAAEPFLVMDLCDGGSLADRLAASETGALPPDESFRPLSTSRPASTHCTPEGSSTVTSSRRTSSCPTAGHGSRTSGSPPPVRAS